MDFTAPVLTPVVNSVMDRVKKELDILVSSSKYVREVHKKEEVLDGAAHDMHNQLESNNANRRMIPHRVPDWLKEVDAIKAEIAEKIPTGGVGCCNMKMKYKAGKDSIYIAERIDRLMKENVEMVWTNELIPLGRVGSPPRSSTSLVVHKDDQSKSKNRNIIKSRDSIFNAVLEFLKQDNDNIQKMALCGMGGVGKSTMMKQLEMEAKEMKTFRYVVPVEVKQKSTEIVQKEVAVFLGEALNEPSDDTRALSLEKRFNSLSSEGVLVILDDVWEEFKLEHIGLKTLPKGLKLLIATREEDVCSAMCIESTSIFKINVLEDPEDKSLFWESAGQVPDGSIDPYIRQIGEDIVKRCGGLPIALVTIGCALKTRTEKSEWRDALSRMKNLKNLRNLTSIFTFCYENLEEADLKAIFLLIGLLSEDHYITIDDLVMYGWGLRFFKDARTIANARDRVEICVNTLIRSNLLIGRDYKQFPTMHDLLRDFVLNNISEVRQASIVYHDKSVLEEIQEETSYERILLKCKGMSEFPVGFNHPNLSFLRLIGGSKVLKFPEDFSTRMKKLEVVSCYRLQHLLLPQFSSNLRVLVLRECRFVESDISFIGDLTNLEVLSLVRCAITRLPSKIGNLKRLRLLDVSMNAGLCIDDGVLEKLVKLEELYLLVSGRRTNFKELKTLSRTLSALELEFIEYKAQPIDFSFENLERFRISVGCSFEYSHNFALVNTLKFNISSSELFECKFNELFVKTEILHLEVDDMSYFDDILVNPPQSAFPNLKDLCISSCASLAFLFTVPVARGLKKLESLQISSCSALKSVISGEPEAGVITFPQLKILHLIDLPELVSLCDLVNVIELPQLMELHLNNLPSITSFFPSNFAKQSFLKGEDVIPSLKRLTISCMENFKEMWPCSGEVVEVNKIPDLHVNDILVHPHESPFPNLKELCLYGCPSLAYVFTVPMVKGLKKLEHLEIRSCSVLRSVVGGEHSEVEVITFPLLKILHLVDLPELVNLCDHIIELPQLMEFDLIGLSNITSFFPREKSDNFSKQSFLKKEDVIPNLQRLSIRGMENLKEIWHCENASGEEEVNKNFLFRNIAVENCNSLVNLFPSNPMQVLDHLENVRVEGCDSIEVLFVIDLVKTEYVNSNSSFRSIVVSSCCSFKEVWRIKNVEKNYFDRLVRRLKAVEFIKIESCERFRNIVTLMTLNVDTETLNGNDIWNDIPFELFQNCQEEQMLYIRLCGALSSVIPCYIAGRMQNLQVLRVERCSRSMTEVFETKEINNNSVAVAISRPTTMHKFPNLKTLYIGACDLLEYVFTLSTLESLKNLETLEISDCRGMKVIVKEEVGEDPTASSKEIVLPHLKSIVLYDLPKLEGFFLGMNVNFQCRLLDTVGVKACPQMVSFTYGMLVAPKLKYIWSDLGKHRLEGAHVTPMLHQAQSPSLDDISSHPTSSKGKLWSFHNLIEYDVYSISSEDTSIFPSNEFQQLENQLETVKAYWHENVVEVFEETNNESQTVVKFSKLREMILQCMDSLKCIWKSNPWRVLEFPNLTTLSIEQCHSLEYVFTCSMVGSMMQLQQLHIENCKKLKVVVKEEEKEDEDEEGGGGGDAKVSEIKFPCLKSLKLKRLPILEGFSLAKGDVTFSSLGTLVIKECPEITVFTHGSSVTPNLTRVKTNFGSFSVIEEEDMNSFIRTKKQEGYKFERVAWIIKYI